MALDLTDAQLAYVDAHEKNEEDLPTYFSATQQADVTISRDFEAFLLLSPDNLKTAAIEWIKQATQIQKTNKDRDALVSLAVIQEITNGNAKIAALNTTLGNFDNFRTAFQTSSSFATVQEVQQFLIDLQMPIDEMVTASDRATFDVTASQVIQRGNDNLTVTDSEIEELQSWTGVFSAYLQS